MFRVSVLPFLQGSSLAAARRASQAVHAEMQAIRANAADTAHPTTAPYFASHSQLAHSSTLLHRTSPDEPGALSKPSGHTARASAHAKHALDGHTWTSGGTHGASRTVGPHTSLLWGPEPATTQTSRAQTGRHTGLTPSADTPTQGLGGEQWDSVGVGVGGVQGGRGVDSRAARGTHSAALHGHRTPGVRDPEGQGESPAYIQELKSQVCIPSHELVRMHAWEVASMQKDGSHGLTRSVPIQCAYLCIGGVCMMGCVCVCVCVCMCRLRPYVHC